MRPKEHLIEVGRRYPDLWKTVEELRAVRGREVPDWSNDVYLPLSLAAALVQHYRASAAQSVDEILRLGALIAWQPTQGIYRFDETVFAAVWETPVEGELPVELLQRLPEWCVYVETPGKSYFAELYGFFAHLDHNPERAYLDLCLLLDTAEGLQPLTVPLAGGGLEQVLRRMFAATPAGSDAPAGTVRRLADHAAPLVSLLIYLCSVNAEVRDSGGTTRQPVKPQPKKTRRGLRLFAPDKPTTWEVAFRLGAALRRAYEQEREPAGDGTHARPRPHIRRAHWHSFWTGKLSQPEQRRLQVRWMPPIAVALSDTAELVPVIHPVK